LKKSWSFKKVSSASLMARQQPNALLILYTVVTILHDIIIAYLSSLSVRSFIVHYP